MFRCIGVKIEVFRGEEVLELVAGLELGVLLVLIIDFRTGIYDLFWMGYDVLVFF